MAFPHQRFKPFSFRKNHSLMQNVEEAKSDSKMVLREYEGAG